jgi:hypothetical protein
MEAGGKGTPLARKHRIYLDFVGIALIPYEYEERPVPIYEGLFTNLHLFVMDPYDIALCKLKRDIDRDLQDMLFLARTTPFDLKVFEKRYREELRPYLFGDVREADFTFTVSAHALAVSSSSSGNKNTFPEGRFSARSCLRIAGSRRSGTSTLPRTWKANVHYR